MRGTIPPLPNMPSWRGAQLKESTGITLPLPCSHSYPPVNIPVFEDSVDTGNTGVSFL
jgi:hypothetical protein